MRRFRCEAKCLDGPAPFAHLSGYGNRISASGTLRVRLPPALEDHAEREFSFQTNCTKVNLSNAERQTGNLGASIPLALARVRRASEAKS
jgi:hypothetical protein